MLIPIEASFKAATQFSTATGTSYTFGVNSLRFFTAHSDASAWVGWRAASYWPS